MALVRWRPTRSLWAWDPFQEVERHIREMEQWLTRLWPETETRSTGWIPAMDLYETDDHYILEMDLPGLQKKNIQIRVEDGVLTISGERNVETPEQCLCQERWAGKFSRSITLPDAADAEHIQAEYKNGVLRLTIPKKESAKPVEIRIK